MENGAWWRGVLIAVLVIGAAAAIGVGSYNAGVAQGFVESGRAVAASGEVSDAHHWHRSWAGGFFPIFPLVFFFFFCAMMRALYWGGMYWGGPWRSRRHYWHDGVPPAFDEWHRRAHANDPPSPKP